MGRLGHCDALTSPRTELTRAAQRYEAQPAWLLSVRQLALPSAWSQLAECWGPWATLRLAKNLQAPNASLPMVLAHLVTAAKAGHLTACVAGPPGAGKTTLFVQFLLLWVAADAGCLTYISHNNSTLVGMSKAIAEHVPLDAPGLASIARFPSQDAPASPLDIDARQRAHYMQKLKVAILTSDMARRDGAGTHLRGWAVLSIVDEAQQAVWMEDIMSCGTTKGEALEVHTGDPLQPRGPASTEAQKAYIQLAKACCSPAY